MELLIKEAGGLAEFRRCILAGSPPLLAHLHRPSLQTAASSSPAAASGLSLCEAPEAAAGEDSIDRRARKRSANSAPDDEDSHREKRPELASNLLSPRQTERQTERETDREGDTRAQASPPGEISPEGPLNKA